MSGFQDPSTDVGNVILLLLIPGLDRAIILQDRATVQGQLSLIAMALAAHKADHKTYPDKLSKLSPGYLKKIPHDIFSGKPFGYEQAGTGRLLYSVGENMKYDGPKKNGDDEENDDIVVQMK